MKDVMRCSIFALLSVGLFAQEPLALDHLSRTQMEEFLYKAPIVNHRALSQGVTNSERATLFNGQLRHDAHIQTVDIHSSAFTTAKGTELNFKDTYKFNVAAYRLDKVLDLNMVPVSVERKAMGKTAALTWWVDNTMMTELDRKKKELEPPSQDLWNKQMYVVRVFDQLIYNTDRNLGNLVIDKDWRIWMIDHTRAFRMMTNLATPKNLVRCDRKFLGELRKLNEDVLMEELLPYLNKAEVKAILARRNLIVRFFDDEIARKGETAVLFDLARQ